MVVYPGEDQHEVALVMHRAKIRARHRRACYLLLAMARMGFGSETQIHEVQDSWQECMREDADYED